MASNDDETLVDPRSPTPAGPLRPGTLLNGIYRIEQLLGRGGMGEVYRATNVANDEQDAIKVIGRALADQPMVENLFRKEARVLASIHSPAVARLKLFAREPVLDVVYFVTEFVSGESLLDRLRRQPARPGELRALLRRVLTGLQAVHEAEAVHRDLSPDNIILPDGDVGRAKIIDFGIAKELDAAMTTYIGDGFAGKLGYIAPEQLGFSGALIGPWTDLYSLALVGAAFAAGRPLDMGHTMGRAEEARRGAIDLSAVPDDLRPVFARLLTYDWRERPQSAGDVLAMLESGSVPPGPVSQPPSQAWAAPAYPSSPTGHAPQHTQASWSPAMSSPPLAAATMPPVWHSTPPVPTGQPSYKVLWIIMAVLGVFAVAIVGFVVWAIMTSEQPATGAAAERPFAEAGIPVQCLPSNVCYQQITAGDGGTHPTNDDAVEVKLSARDASGTDTYVEHTQSAMPSGREAGFEEVLTQMTVGAHFRVWATPAFAEGGTVIYDVTLLAISPLSQSGGETTSRSRRRRG